MFSNFETQSKWFYIFFVRKVWVVDQVTQFHQPISINSKPDQKSEQSEMNRPTESGDHGDHHDHSGFFVTHCVSQILACNVG